MKKSLGVIILVLFAYGNAANVDAAVLSSDGAAAETRAATQASVHTEPVAPVSTEPSQPTVSDNPSTVVVDSASGSSTANSPSVMKFTSMSLGQTNTVAAPGTTTGSVAVTANTATTTGGTVTYLGKSFGGTFSSSPASSSTASSGSTTTATSGAVLGSNSFKFGQFTTVSAPANNSSDTASSGTTS